MNLFELVGTIAIVGAAKAQSDIDATGKKASSASEKFKNGIATVGKWGAAIGVAAIGGAKALTNFATKAASTADNVDKMSQKIGISRQGFQELDFICSQSGMSIDSLQGGMKTLTTAMDKASDSTSEQAQLFAQLGVSVTNADGTLRSQEEVMWETMEALQGVENQTEKARLATQLFGKAGTEMMPLLNGASGSIDDMKKKAHSLGLVMSDEAIDAGVSLTDTLDQMKRSIGAVANNLGASLAPILQSFAEMIIQFMPQIQNLFNQLAPILQQFFASIMPILMQIVEAILPVLIQLFETLLPPIMQIVETILPPILQIIQELLPPLIQIIGEILPVIIELLQPILELLQPILEVLTPILEVIIALISPLLELITMILKPIIKLLTTVFGKLAEFIKPIIEWLAKFLGGALKGALNVIITVIKAVGSAFSAVWDGIKKVWSGAANFFKGIWNGIKNAFGAVADWFGSVFSKAWGAVKKVFSVGGKIFDGIKDGIVTAFKAVVNAIIKGINTVVGLPFKAINAVLKKIKGISILGVHPFGWVKTFPVPAIPLLEQGGILEKGQVGLLEGNGAEAVVPLEKNKKWIHALAEDMRMEFGNTNNNALVKKLDEVISAISSMKVYLDTGVMVGEMTPALDSSLGNLYAAKGRGR